MKITKNILLCVYKDMADDLQLQWQITAMDCYPVFSGQKDYAFQVYWDCSSYYSGISGGPFYGRVSHATPLPVNTGEFIPFIDLTPPLILSWIWDSMGPELKDNYEQSVCSKIYNQLTPQVIRPRLPWINTPVSMNL